MTAATTTLAPTAAQLQQAFGVMRGAGWPATLAELQLDPSPLATARMGIVLGAARRLAHGGHPERPDLCGPVINPVTRAPIKHAPQPLPARRHGDVGDDRKRAAAGDRDDQ